MTIARALLSVSNKDGIAEFAGKLAAAGVTLVSSGGTARAIADAGVAVTKVADVTGAPEILGGRVKTLHPKIHGGILADRRQESHVAELKDQGIEAIDLVVVNLYPFTETIAKPGVTLDEAIENIDIGGPAMVRAAAKNYHSVAVVVDPADYDRIAAAIAQDGSLSLELRQELSLKAFRHTASYDATIVGYFAGVQGQEDLEEGQVVSVSHRLERKLRYGENPHQAAFVAKTVGGSGGLLEAEQLHGKELSYNNYIDFQAAWVAARDFEAPCSALIKHTNPCGLAEAGTLLESFRQAHACDPVSAFGGVFALNRVIDKATAEAIHATGFFEGIVAPGYEPAALEVLKKRKNRMLLALPEEQFFAPAERWKPTAIIGGALWQEDDTKPLDKSLWEVKTKRQPTAEEEASLTFAWKVAKHVKSNAIVLAQGRATVGVGAGQMSRVDSSMVAAHKAGERAQGCVLASDAFFPFRDGIDAAAKAGAVAVIQPGGSKNDQEVIDAADEHGMAMIFTARRHFKH